MLEVAGGGGAPADGAGAGGVPDLGQVAELDPGVVALGRKAVVAVVGGDRVERDGQVGLSAGPAAQCPGAVSARWGVLAGGGEGEPWPVPVPGPARWSRSLWFPVTFGFGSGAAVADGVPVLVGDGDAPGGLGVAGGGVGKVAGEGGVSQSRSKYT